ncbi:MAG TPA: tryptophan--tRNA ligase [Candidatus Saccharimonadales bacterium]|nr:tryptophan--tRNA ligase [Candidatus Saccharimonadales bacterium]
MQKEVVLTGLRSNAEFHLGNYLGAILPMVELQKKHAGQYQLNMFIPDLHSFTTPIDHGSLYEQTLKNLKVFVAAGLDIDQPDTFIYRQSYIAAHSEMTWILDCFTYFGELSRMTEFKEKGGQNETVSVGLFNYPVLMAADILLYGAKWVPVGDDQRQHVEFTRDLAIRMNNKFGELLVVPEENAKQTEFAGRSEPVRIRSLRNPEKKMSKSVDDPAGTIMLTDDPNDAAQKIMSAETDSLSAIPKGLDWEKQPGVSNLLQILAILKDDWSNVFNKYQGNTSYADLKKETAVAVSEFLANFQAKMSLVDEPKLVSRLEADENAMSEAANATLLKVQKAVGLRPT